MSVLEEVPGLAQARGGVFYLYGDDEYRKEEAVRALIAAHLDPATSDFNFDPISGRDVDTETLASVIATPPMMAEWRVVIVREVEGLTSSPRSREVLLEAAERPPSGLALILSATVPQGSKAKFYSQLARTARSVEFQPLTPADIPGWIMAQAQARHGVEVQVDAAQALGAAIGVDLGVLSRELEKLSEFVGDRGRIEIADVEAAGTRLPTQDRWRWFDLVGGTHFQEALTTLEVLFRQGESGVGLVIGLTTHLLRLGIVAERGPAALEAALPPHQRWLARRLTSQARQWRPEALDRALEALLRVDRLLKASPLSEEHFLEEWLLGLLVQEAAA